MPFESKSQMRACYAAKDPDWNCTEWAHHTKNIKKLPEHVKKTQEKKAEFVHAFIIKCAREGLTTPAQIAAAAEALLKQADVADALGRVIGTGVGAGIVGSVAIPGLVGYGLGASAAGIRNHADEEDADALRLRAEANAYRRRAAEAKTHAQVRQLVNGDPSKYVVIG